MNLVGSSIVHLTPKYMILEDNYMSKNELFTAYEICELSTGMIVESHQNLNDAIESLKDK